jgi:ubiquinone/menaquinone biosynthesis C-methylase UbiE
LFFWPRQRVYRGLVRSNWVLSDMGQSTVQAGRGNPAEFWDYVDYVLNVASKAGRLHYDPAGSSAEYYDTFFSEIDVANFADQTDPRRTLRASVLEHAVTSRVSPNARVLDVGCGTGDNLRIFADRGLELHGIEYASVSAAHAVRLLGPRADVRTGSATTLPYPNAHFDAVICIEVLEHVQDDVAAMQEIARVLKPSGVLVFTVPYRRYFDHYLKTMGHFRHYTRASAVEVLKKAGLEPTEYLPNYPRWSRFANYAYVSCRVAAGLGCVMGMPRRPHTVRLPFCRRPMMEMLFDRLTRLRATEESVDYASRNTSTFIAAQHIC